MKAKRQSYFKQSPVYVRALSVVVLAIFIFSFPGYSYASSPDAGSQIPHVDDKARENYLQYQYAGKNRAFAIAPGGAWAWRSDAGSEAEAESLALQTCQSYTKQKCVLYALNDKVVFDARRWPTLWGPYGDGRSADKASTGAAVDERFYDLMWKKASGDKVTLSDLRGKLVFLHFWGSWCPPCLREFPSLKTIHARIKEKFPSDVEMVMLQLREPFDESRLWVERYEFTDLPLYDSGADSEVTTLTLPNGQFIEDRAVARVFPSTYVLDRNGLVVFSHHGPVSDWLEYLPFLEHAVAVTSDNVEVKVRTAIEQ